MFKFSGVAPPAVTPFKEDGSVDKKSYKDLLDWWIDNGVHGIVPCGSNGEVSYLTKEERIELIEITVDQVAGRASVIAGTGFPSTQQTIEMTKVAKHIGADAALIVTPFYYPIDQEELFEHYRQIAEEVNIPIILYNVPKFTHQNLEAETVIKLSKFDNIIGIKESSGNLTSIQQIIAGTEKEDFDLLAGSGSLFYATLQAGGKGGILALANVAPKECSEIFNLFSEGNLEKARELNYKLIKLNQAITKTYGIAGLKFVLKLLGQPAGIPRPPLQPLSVEEKKAIQSIAGEVFNIDRTL